VVAHVALLTVQVEVDVVGQVDRTGLINRRTILDGDTVIVGQTIVRRGVRLPGNPDRHQARSARTALPVVGADNLPAALIKPFRAAVQLVAPRLTA
jgi:hypothetical protein